MTQGGSSLLALLALVLLAQRGGATTRAPSSAPKGPGLPSSGKGRRVPTRRTGEADPLEWFRRRMAITVPALGALEPPLVGARADRVALALVAQWAHETDRGRAEFNFNLGGWTARKRDDFHEAVDRLSQSHFRWTAYADLPTAIEDQIRRLILGFPRAWALLLAEPESSAWIEELGRAGYYTAPTSAYARAWAMQRTELGKVKL